jgi:hypothetical protein
MHLKNTTGQPCYVVGIALPPGIQPFKLARKRAAYRPHTKYQPSRAIVSVDPVGSKPAQCIAVDSPDQLYVTDDFVVTHNTVQAIAALRLLMFRREMERALVVVPASLLEQWRRELLNWAPELRVMLVHGPPEDRSWRWQYRAHVTLTSYDILRIDYTGSATCGPCRERWGVVVLDEAQKIKNRDTDVARACKGLPRDRSWALTGTPLENSAEDVLSILEFVTGGGGTGRGGDGATGRRGDGETDKVKDGRGADGGDSAGLARAPPPPPPPQCKQPVPPSPPRPVFLCTLR